MLELEIARIAYDLWDTMFGMNLMPGTADVLPGPTLTGIVHIDGAWQGAVTVQFPVTLAAALTTQLFGRSTEPEMRDLAGELTNQLAGNIKGMLPGPSSLSLPAVALGQDVELRVVTTRVGALVTLSCQGTPIVITLLERTR